MTTRFWQDFLVKQLFKQDEVLWINLLDDNLYREYLSNPGFLEQRIGSDSPQSLFQKDLGPCDFWVVSQEKTPRTIDALEILPWAKALQRLFPI
jgi:hypothetical protein